MNSAFQNTYLATSVGRHRCGPDGQRPANRCTYGDDDCAAAGMWVGIVFWRKPAGEWKACYPLRNAVDQEGGCSKMCLLDFRFMFPFRFQAFCEGKKTGTASDTVLYSIKIVKWTKRTTSFEPNEATFVGAGENPFEAKVVWSVDMEETSSGSLFSQGCWVGE